MGLSQLFANNFENNRCLLEYENYSSIIGLQTSQNGCKYKFTAFKLVLLVQPSLAAAERVFSLLQNSFSQRQSSSLEDYIETSLMLQHNR